jgi:hypothetical protein
LGRIEYTKKDHKESIMNKQETKDFHPEPEVGYAEDGVVWSWGCATILAVIGIGFLVLAFGGLIMRVAGL